MAKVGLLIGFIIGVLSINIYFNNARVIKIKKKEKHEKNTNKTITYYLFLPTS